MGQAGIGPADFGPADFGAALELRAMIPGKKHIDLVAIQLQRRNPIPMQLP
jgi:hypothetical protein